ncbi:MAG: DUF1080 domain-containing protein [Bacteroidota bacterium]
MKQVILVVILMAPLLACETMQPQTNQNNSQAEWIVLFDGTNMDHWRGYRKEVVPAEWQIEDGALAFNPGEKGGKNIITKEKYTNFILSLEWKISEKGNSGIFWGVSEEGGYGEPYRTGPEIQVLDNYGHPDGKYDTHTAGSLYDMIGVSREITKPVGQWNLCVIEINQKDNLGKVSLNGTELYSFPLHGKAWDAMVANSKFKDWEGFGKYQTGYIGLQDHDDKVWYRNIRIKKLD